MKAYKVIGQNHPAETIHAETIKRAWIEYLEGHEGAVVTAVFEESLYLEICPHDECCECAMLVCPHGEPLHFHHDGSPACDGEYVKNELNYFGNLGL